MGNYLSNSLSNLLELFTAHTHKPSALKSTADITQMVEHVVDVIDPKIRVIGRYSQKLSQPVSQTWEYLNDMANLIPGGTELNRSRFAGDPRLKLIFDSQGVIQQLLESLPPLIHEKVSADTSHRVHMLLCMEKSEHNFLGTELAGDIIKRDVLQTRVSFLNRKILSAGYAVDDAKLGFKKCALEGLLHKAHTLVLDTRNEQKQLIERKKQLHQQLHTIHDAKYQPHSTIFSRNDHLTDTSPELLDIERRLTELRIKSESPDQHLTQTIEVLSHPEQYLKLVKHSLHVDKLGIKLTGDNIEHGYTIEYAEIEIEQSLKRITMIVDCAAEEIFAHQVH
ncbi:hypothetical protein [Kaarinaea lacus]